MSAQAIPTDADYVQLSALLGVWEGDLVLRCSARDRTHQAVSDTEYLLKVNRKRITIVTSAFEELLSATTQNWAESSETRSITPRQVPELELDEDWLVIWFLVGSIYQIPEYAYLLYPGREWHILFELYQAAYKYAMAGARYSITTSLTLSASFMDPEEAVMVYARASAYNDKSLAKAMLPKAARVPLHLIPAQVRQEIPADALERLMNYEEPVTARGHHAPRGLCGTTGRGLPWVEVEEDSAESEMEPEDGSDTEDA